MTALTGVGVAPGIGAADFAVLLARVGQAALPVSALGEAASQACWNPASPGRIAVGVSGGPHSLALALLARDWALPRGIRLLALIADHGLRPESAAEAAQVCAMLERQGIATRILALRMAPGPALQERARIARLAALLAACHAAGALWLLLGHHRLDQAETLLLRAARGSGEAGLAGMSPRRVAAQALILRPLLDTAPRALEAVCTAAGLFPVRDPSNQNHRFARIRTRAALDDPGGDGPRSLALAAAAQAFAHRRQAADATMLTRLATAVELRAEGAARIDAAALGQDDVARHLLGQLLRAVGGAAHAPAHAAVLALLARGQGTLAGAWWRDDGWLLREPALVAPPVPADAGVTWDGRFHLAEAVPGCRLGALGALSEATIGQCFALPLAPGAATPFAPGAATPFAPGATLPLALRVTLPGAALPRAVRQTLPALWLGDELYAVPHFGLGPPVPGLHFQPIGGPVGVLFAA